MSTKKKTRPKRAVKPDRLAALAQSINQEHGEVEESLRHGLLHAKRAGDLLIMAKNEIGHGGFLSWLKANVKFSQRMARYYMTISRCWDQLVNRQEIADLTVSHAIQMLIVADAIEKGGKPDTFHPCPGGKPGQGQADGCNTTPTWSTEAAVALARRAQEAIDKIEYSLVVGATTPAEVDAIGDWLETMVKEAESRVRTPAVQVAAEILAHDRTCIEDRKRMLQDARKLSESLDYGSLHGLQARIARGDVDATKIRGLDDVAELIAEKYPEHFAGHSDHRQRLFDMLVDGNPEPLSEDAALEQADALEQAAVPF